MCTSTCAPKFFGIVALNSPNLIQKLRREIASDCHGSVDVTDCVQCCEEGLNADSRAGRGDLKAKHTQGMGTARRTDTLTKTKGTHGTAYTQTDRRAISEVETDGENEATPELNHRRWEKEEKLKAKHKLQWTIKIKQEVRQLGKKTKE